MTCRANVRPKTKRFRDADRNRVRKASPVDDGAVFCEDGNVNDELAVLAVVKATNRVHLRPSGFKA